MTYDPRDTDPLYVEEYDLSVKPGVPRAVLVWGFGMVLVLLAILAAALLLRGGAA